MKQVALKGAGTVIESEAKPNLALLSEVAALVSKDEVLQATNDAQALGEARTQASNKQEKAIADLRSVIAGEDENG